MKLLIVLFSLLINGAIAQSSLDGKTFVCLLSESCKKMIDGGCMINTYRVLEFGTDSVLITYRVKAYCSPESVGANYEDMYDQLMQKHSWSLTNGTIQINGFDEYGMFGFYDTSLTGNKEINGELLTWVFKKE